jgi:hypothetical protein
MFIGNRLSDNALTADDGQALIERALAEVEREYGWRPHEASPLYRGRFYESGKIGSFITRVTNRDGDSAVLKLQLRPVPYDEGMIIRHIRPQIRTERIRLPGILFDEPWSEEKGYGILVSEDASAFPRLWKDHCPTEEELKRHEDFLGEFMHYVLPIDPFLPVPDGSVRERHREMLDHFSDVAQASTHQHIDLKEVEGMKERYARILGKAAFDGFHFTHAHLSGMEIRIDPDTQAYVLFSNLLWSFRPTYYEALFPFWVDAMGIRDVNVSSDDLYSRVDRWAEMWKRVMGEDPRKRESFRFLILERAMMTTMLDLGASEWNEDEIKTKQALLNAWKQLFERLAEEFSSA